MKLLVQKSLRLTLLLMFIAGASCYAFEDVLTKKQAGNYIEHVIKTVFSSGHSGSYAQEIAKFVQKTVNSLKNNHVTAHELYPIIIERTLKFIEQKSMSYAQRELEKCGQQNSYRATEIAQKIVQQARSLINHSPTLPDSALAPFVGANLRAKVQQMVNSQKRKKTYNQTVSYPVCMCDYNYTRVPVVTTPVVSRPVTYTVTQPTYYNPVEIIQPAVSYAPLYSYAQPQNWFSFDFGFKL